MKSSYNKSLFVCFFLLIFGTTLISAYSIYTYWQNGILASENLSMIDSASSQIDRIEKNETLKEAHRYVLSDNVSKSIAKVNELNEEINNVESSLGESYSKEWFEYSKELTKRLNDIQSVSSVKTLFNVLNKKVEAFNSYVVENKWRTLTRVSNQIKVRLKPFQSNYIKNNFNKNLINFQKRLEKDINYMEVITKSSVLSNVDKNNIVLKLDSLRKEVNLLKEYTNFRSSYFKQFKKSEQVLKSWLNSVRPAVIDQKVELSKSTQNILYVLLAVFASCIISMIVGYAFYVYSAKKNQVLVEKNVDNLLKEGIIPLDGKVEESWSHQFRESVQVYREYIHKRMSFGSIFQDAMPFSSILLDSNLNLVWANSLFFEHWNIDKEVQKSQNYTWDSLQRFTNLGEDDPIVTAIKENIAGIYQIQVKTEKDESGAPFEMYVSPVEYAGQKRIMVIFYPLRSIEETMRNQLKSVVGPVSRSVEAILNENFTGDVKEKIEEDFNIADLENIYTKFETLSNTFRKRKLSFLNEIEDLENQNHYLSSQVDFFRNSLEKRKAIEEVVMNNFSETKKNIIEALDSKNDIDDLFKDLSEVTKNIMSKDNKILTSAEDIIKVLSENQKTVESIVNIKEEFKSLKTQAESHRSRINNLIDYCTRGQVSNETLEKVQIEVKQLEDVLVRLGKVATSLDVSLSKAQIIMESNQVPHLDEERGELKELGNRANNLIIERETIESALDQRDEKLVKSLKSLYTGFQKLRHTQTTHPKENQGEVTL